MLSVVLRRLLLAPVVLLVLASLSFFIMRLAPGGPFQSERAIDPEVRAALEHRYHLDEPMWRQYLRFLGDCAHGDLGESMSTYKGRPVTRIIAATLPVSVVLGVEALLLAILIGTFAGVGAALFRHGVTDRGGLVVALVAVSMPTFVTGPLLALVFGLWLHWLPIAGWHGIRHPLDQVLPSCALALPFAGRIARLTRASMLEVLSQEFIRTARAKGATTWRIALWHALRPAYLPVIAYLGPATANILTGSVVIEQVFSIPGLGREFVASAFNRDFTLVMGTVLVYGALLVAATIAADLLQAFLDPRIRHA